MSSLSGDLEFISWCQGHLGQQRLSSLLSERGLSPMKDQVSKKRTNNFRGAGDPEGHRRRGDSLPFKSLLAPYDTEELQFLSICVL